MGAWERELRAQSRARRDDVDGLVPARRFWKRTFFETLRGLDHQLHEPAARGEAPDRRRFSRRASDRESAEQRAEAVGSE